MGPGLDRLAPPASLVDWSILVLVGLEVCSGLVSLTAATPDWGWLFTLHAVGGLVLVVLLFWKFRRVGRRLTDPGGWSRERAVSALLAGLAVVALGSGIAWTLSGVVRIGPWTLLTGHMLAGLAVVPVLVWHLRHRFRLPRRRDLEGRRTALEVGATMAFGAVLWRLQGLLNSLRGIGPERRFTGSSGAGGRGNDFPVTSWVADDPEPIDVDDWRLTVTGELERPLSLGYGALTAREGDARTDERAVLDCTSGWYADRTWQGVSVGAVLEAAGPTEEANWVRFRSVTGYRWSLPIEEARTALLATHVDGEPLAHGHGAPLRLVAPGRRGFQWVKWVRSVEVTRSRDLGQWIAIFVSGL